ncbi:hypothetical protein BDZ94DRAFT_1164036 [Collybia nuda]|uniref:G domain-containing protein n=1 Tax=Collybia nuda TaxID=64659 RepID=A0A9P5Y4G1_9AGAR|nr:hypothetical protein BDZ94DRAFT_1164036 [Collybia nuda]
MAEIQSNTSQITNPSEDEKQARREKLAKKAGRFRILIVGRANAGKTTILKKICNTTDDPEIYDSRGNKIDTLKIEPTAKRGTHDIENEMIFRSNTGFIFHDSRGFEAGGVDELQKVQDFILKRSKEKKLENQIHVIWYCIAMSDSRPIVHSEEQFFSALGTGKVPVIAVFTKCEALETKAFIVLQEEHQLSSEDAFNQAPAYVKKHLQNIHLKLEKYKYPPKGHVYIQEMEKAGTDCMPLLDRTASVLDGDVLQAIFVSTQQASVEMCVKYAIRYGSFSLTK